MQYENLLAPQIGLSADEIKGIVDASIISDNFQTKTLDHEYGFIDTLMHGVTVYNQKKCCVKDVPKCDTLYVKVKEIQNAEAYDLLFSFSKEKNITKGSVLIEEICPKVKYVASYGESDNALSDNAFLDDDLSLTDVALLDGCHDCYVNGLIL